MNVLDGYCDKEPCDWGSTVPSPCPSVVVTDDRCFWQPLKRKEGMKGGMNWPGGG